MHPRSAPRPGPGRRARLLSVLDQTGADIRYALRFLARSPGFTLVAAGCLALAIGANTSTFGIINALALRPPAGVADPGSLRSLYQSAHDRFGPVPPRELSYSEFRIYQKHLEPVAQVVASAELQVTVARGTEPRDEPVQLVSENYFRVLGALPRPGRGFAEDEGRTAGKDLVAVVSHEFWRNELGGSPGVLGTPLRVGGQPFTVVGVAPPGFAGHVAAAGPDGSVRRPALWVPASALPVLRPGPGGSLDAPDGQLMRVAVRLRPGVSEAELAGPLTGAAREVAARFPRARAGAEARLSPLWLGPADTPASAFATLALLMAAPVVVLAIACANLANLLLARAAQRSREIGIRLALGASRGRLVRQLLVEALVLASLGAAADLLFLLWLPEVVAAAGWRLPEGSLIDRNLLVFTAAVVVATTLLFGLAPALRSTRRDLAAALRDGGAQGGSARSRARGALVVVQVTLSTVLLVSCALLVLGARRAQHVELGMRREGLVVARVDFGAAGYDAARARTAAQALEQALRGVPGVEAVGRAGFLPLESLPEEQLRGPDGQELWSKTARVEGDFFAAAGLRLQQGRPPRPGAGEVVVTRALAARLPAGRPALGSAFRLGEGEDAGYVMVVGVADDLRLRPEGEPEAVVLLVGTGAEGAGTFYVRGRSAGAETLVPALRRAIREADPALAAADVRPADAWVSQALRPAWLTAVGVGALGALALALAAAGVFAVISFLVALRTREMGIRISLGATATGIVALVVREAVQLAAIGTGLGLVLAIGVAGALRSLLSGASPFDPLAFAAVALALVATALVASVVPALRAARVDPMTALRVE